MKRPLIDSPSAQKIFLFLILAIHIAYFVCALIIGVFVTEDSPEYLHMANNMLKGALYSGDLNEPYDMKFLTLRPPGYSIFLVPWVVLSNSPCLILFVQNLLSISTLLGLWMLWKEMRPSTANIHWAVIGTVLFPTGMIYVNMIMAEVLFQSLMFWAFYCFVRYVKGGSSGFMLGYNLLLTSALFVKPVLLYFWVPNLLLTLGMQLYRKDLSILPMPLILALCALLYSSYNESRTGYFHFSSIKNINVLNFNARQLLRTQYGQTYADSVISSIQAEAQATGSFREEYGMMEQRGKDLVMASPVDYFYVHARGALSFFLDPGRHDLVLFFDIQSEERMGFFNELDKNGLKGILHYARNVNLWLLTLMGLLFIWHMLLLLSWLHTAFFGNIDLRIRAVLLLLVGYIAMLSVTIGYARFRVEVYPLLLFPIPFFWEHLKTMFTNKLNPRR